VGGNKVMARLKQLYELTKIRPEEEDDKGRLEEARTASYVLLKYARENGVKVKFEVPKAEASPPKVAVDHGTYAGAWNPYQARVEVPITGDFDDLFKYVRDAQSQAHARNRADAQARAQHVASAKRRAEEAKRAQSSEERFEQDGRGKVEMDEPVLLTAKFSNPCRHCGKKYEAGAHVWWRRGIGCVHQGCDKSVLGGKGGAPAA
jgi:hypothetical protein